MLAGLEVPKIPSVVNPRVNFLGSGSAGERWFVLTPEPITCKRSSKEKHFNNCEKNYSMTLRRMIVIPVAMILGGNFLGC